MELVHHHVVDVGVLAFGERHVGQNFRGAADHRRVAVHGRVAGHHAHVLGSELATQVEELFGDQRLDRAGVE
jgi:hypothetical protein